MERPIPFYTDRQPTRVEACQASADSSSGTEMSESRSAVSVTYRVLARSGRREEGVWTREGQREKMRSESHGSIGCTEAPKNAWKEEGKARIMGGDELSAK